MTAVETRPNTLPWPPIVYVAAVAAAIVLNWLVPLPWIPGPLGELLFAVGWLVVGGALAIDTTAMRTMARAKTTIMPHRGSDHLVTSGPFSFTRNPIYLGNTMLMIGIGLIAGIVWFILLAPVAAFVTQKLAIEREERHLEMRFGKKYRDYAKKVRRWI
ncbi:methyltransferase family protein [Neoaquamicrobium sediminum]|uniref:methyltransferase family protein n=1 Tax=Neoaquamicrobium sediminum TaxID=1849104 RepID=UPI001565E370|nr:methyltransferase [Mesorhizobium sediminum]NRC54940.1 isoprenylcysteine carboxylmethyltransferase family protein [Mesorhizobium sediminum]